MSEMGWFHEVCILVPSLPLMTCVTWGESFSNNTGGCGWFIKSLEWGLAHGKPSMRSPAISVIVIGTKSLLLPVLSTWCILPYFILKIIKQVLLFLLHVSELRHTDSIEFKSGQLKSRSHALTLLLTCFPWASDFSSVKPEIWTIGLQFLRALKFLSIFPITFTLFLLFFPRLLPHPHSSCAFHWIWFIITGSAGCSPHWAVTRCVSDMDLCCGLLLNLVYMLLLLGEEESASSVLLSYVACSHYHTEWRKHLTGLEKGFMGEARGISSLGLGSAWFSGRSGFEVLHSLGHLHESGPWLVKDLRRGTWKRDVWAWHFLYSLGPLADFHTGSFTDHFIMVPL